ncbi:hypothetical protein GCM10027563_40390 [Parasphingorhabdus pacifica]
MGDRQMFPVQMKETCTGSEGNSSARVLVARTPTATAGRMFRAIRAAGRWWSDSYTARNDERK